MSTITFMSYNLPTQGFNEFQNLEFCSMAERRLGELASRSPSTGAYFVPTAEWNFFHSKTEAMRFALSQDVFTPVYQGDFREVRSAGGGLYRFAVGKVYDSSPTYNEWVRSQAEATS